MTRFITSHQVNPANDSLTIKAVDKPGSGGAHHLYHIDGFDTGGNPSNVGSAYHGLEVLFQSGPIAEAGVNGITHEALISVLIDRLQCFQAGGYACAENAAALAALEEAQHQLHSRTTRRVAAGIEGTHALDGEQLSRDLTDAARGEAVGG